MVSPAQPFVVKFPTLEPAETRDLHRSLSASRAACGLSKNCSLKCEGSGPVGSAPARPARLWRTRPAGAPRGARSGTSSARVKGPPHVRAGAEASPAGPGMWMARPRDVRGRARRSGNMRRPRYSCSRAARARLGK